MQDKTQLILRVSRETGLPVKKILDMLFLLRGGVKENNLIVRQVGVSKNVLNQVKAELSEWFAPASKVTGLSKKGEEMTEQLFPIEFQVEEKLWSYLEDERFFQITRLLEKFRELRPKPFREYDQFSATTETTARRAMLMSFFADIKGKRLLFLGDDDFTSVAVSMFGIAGEIMVLDIDERILGGIRTIADEERFPIRTERCDARNKFPQKYCGRFDVVFTDPPYTPDGVRLFLSRAIQALDQANQAGRIYCCYGNSDRARERFLSIQELFVKSGLMVRWIFDKFNRYDGADSIGSASSVFICDVTAKTKPLIEGDYHGEIYTG